MMPRSLMILILLAVAGCNDLRDRAIGQAAADAGAMARAIPLALDDKDENAARVLAASSSAICAGIQQATAPNAAPTMEPATYAKAPESAPAIAKTRIKAIEEAAQNPWWVSLLLQIGGALGLDSGLLGTIAGVLVSGGAGAGIFALAKGLLGGQGSIVERLVQSVQAARAALSPTNQAIVDQQLQAAQDAATKRAVEKVKRKLDLKSVKKPPYNGNTP